MTASTSISQLNTTELLCLVGLALASVKLISTYATGRRKLSYPALHGPPRPNWLYGVEDVLNKAPEAEVIIQNWMNKYGSVFSLPAAMGKNRIVIADTKALNHFFSKETFVYVKTASAQILIENVMGHNLLWAEGQEHRRQRKTMSPAFSNAAIRRLVSVFYDSAHKVADAWDNQMSIEPNPIIEVQGWMNRIALDSIGIAGFGHDFQYLSGVQSPIVNIFNIISDAESNFLSTTFMMFGQNLPFLLKLPTGNNKVMKSLKEEFSRIADVLLDKMRSEKQSAIGKETAEEKSIIGMLVKAESGGVDKEEIIAQSLLLFAGYETSSGTLTWALIELCRNLDAQKRLREELQQFGNENPTWDQLASNLPYLDAVVHEILRLHPAVNELLRISTEDDVLPLSAPVTLSTGESVTSLAVPKDTFVVVPVTAINTSTQFWGADAAEFRPERWLDLNDPSKDGELGMKSLPGHRHLLTFSDGPRLCLGRAIALTELKATISVLIRNFMFEFPRGPKTEIGRYRGVALRPKVVGEKGVDVPMRITKVEQY